MGSIDKLNKVVKKASAILDQTAEIDVINKAVETAKKEVSFKNVVSGFELLDGNQNASPSGEIEDGVGLVLQNAAERASDLIRDVGDAKTDLESVTGSAKLSANGFLNVTVSAPFPAAIADSLKATTTATKAEINSIVQKSTSAPVDILDSIIGDVFGSAQSATKDLLNSVSKISLGVDNFLNAASKGFGNLIEDFIEEAFEGLAVKVSTIAIKDNIPLTIPVKVSKEIADLKSKGLVEVAAEKLVSYSDKPKNDIIKELASVKTKASDILEGDQPAVEKPVDVIDIDELKNEWLEENTPTSSKVFSLVGKTEAEIESLINEFTNLVREVTDLIIVGYSYEVDETSSETHSYYAQEIGVGHPAHFQITQTGSVYRARPLEIITAPSDYGQRTNHDHSIILYVNSFSDISPAQSNSIKFFINTLLLAFPGLQVYDLNNLGGYDPYLGDVEKWMKLNFPYRRNLPIEIYDPQLEGSLSQSALVKKLNTVG